MTRCTQLLLATTAIFLCAELQAAELELKKGARVVLVGSGLGSRMMHYGHFETMLHQQYPDHQLVIRNICDEGNTPGFRPHSGRVQPWAFPGADKFRTLSKAKDRWGGNSGAGHFDSPDGWLRKLKPDVIVAIFGYSESYDGPGGLPTFKAELEAFIKHVKSQKYNGEAAPQVALVSPIAFQDLSADGHLPDGTEQNANLALYTKAMQDVAKAENVHFTNLFAPSIALFAEVKEPLTRDGALLTDKGYAKVSPMLVNGVFGRRTAKGDADAIKAAVLEKNWMWQNYFKIPNGVHVFGRRHRPYGPANYPFELKKLEQMVDARDQAIWATIAGKAFDLEAADAKTDKIPNVGKTRNPKYQSPEDTLKTLKVPDGYKIALFADEVRFPDLRNPVQMSFDNKGRLWIATMPSYPHYKPGDPRPDDKLLIFEDTDNDGVADKQKVFADKLHLPMGFEFSHDGVYVEQNTSLVFLQDTDGDDKADVNQIVMSGFDDHDTHHAISAFCADPSGAIMMGEGTFLHSHIETAYGPIRSSNGGFFRYDPVRRKLSRTARLSIPNPWGIAFDDWGQDFFAETSNPDVRWMLPGSVRVGFGNFAPLPPNLLKVRVRPTSGLEFISSRHFPDEVQGDMLINNNIGFLGTKQHKMIESGTGFQTSFRHDLLKGGDRNFRPVDMEFAPDGSLYMVDWHNALIGHMQHNARDPDRDHNHGRVYRITYPARPLVKPAKVAGADIGTLLENLKLPEYRTRYRTRRELRGRDTDKVLAALKTWTASLDKSDKRYEHHLVEALWVSWGLNRVDTDLVRTLLKAEDFRARCAAVRAIRYNGHQMPDHAALLKAAAGDEHGRVKLEATVAASWLGKADGMAILDAVIGKTDKRETKPKPTEKAFATVEGDIMDFAHPKLKATKVDAVTILLPGSNKVLNLSEAEVISGGKNIAKQAKATQSSLLKGYPVSMLIDGNKGNFAHTQGEDDPWFKLVFPQPISIDKVKVWNRAGYADRFKGGQVVFSAGKTKVATVHLDGTTAAATGGLDSWLKPVYGTAFKFLNGQQIKAEGGPTYKTTLTGKDKASFMRGAAVFGKDGHCGTCHQADGNGLPEAQFPPLAGSKWVTGSDERLIKLALHGLSGPIQVKGKTYPGAVPMTPFKMLNDQEMADVLTFVRNAFGNTASVVSARDVEKVRKKTKDQATFYSPAELLKAHPH
jgi:mono/diheme cytochrome c family protein/glucose/arabinose dehydrogenase